ncbi:ABC transporter permease [Microbacterium sp.]|uniref:ABC transporter permease n=1 Tax=Microbacterium sp. TaxID=51671 RepID=UPI003F945182
MRSNSVRSRSPRRGAGVALVVILGGIDVSTGFAVRIVAWTVAKLSGAGLPAFVVVVATVVVGALLGAINGILVTFGKVPPIIATLGTAAIFQTALFALWNSNDLFAAPIAPIFSGERVLGVPMVVVPVIIVYALLAWFMYKRPAGRELYATGSNPEAARLAGIRVNRLTFLAYLTIGVLVGLAGLIYVGRVGVVQASSGNEVTLLAIAAVVVGGTSILGGEGSVLRTLGGLVFIVVLQNGIVLAGVPPLWNGLFHSQFLSAKLDRVDEQTARVPRYSVKMFRVSENPSGLRWVVDVQSHRVTVSSRPVGRGLNRSPIGSECNPMTNERNSVGL